MTKTTSKPVYIADLHFEHSLWVRQLDFYKDEVGIFENRLEQLVQRWDKHEVLAQLERFQNQFIREKEVIDILRHDINAHESSLAAYAKAHPIAIEQVHFADHEGLRERMSRFRQIFEDLKNDFMIFIAKYL
ncbi:MAG: hypothetical protein KDC54_11215 [Lewinella sp.]|nr:hypothetical protein [Lewinella sp.]